MTQANPPRPGEGGSTPPAIAGVALRLVFALRDYTNESDLYVAAAGRGAEMHRTDLAGLALALEWDADRDGPLTPGRLSRALQLSPPATTAMLDRLQRAGHLTREASSQDRRSVAVTATDHAQQTADAIFERLRVHMATLLATRDDAELAVITAFVEEAVAATRRARSELGSSLAERSGPQPEASLGEQAGSIDPPDGA